ncbi:MAG: patatin-like phospholipase family protein [Alistipes sp.]|nr:patatin-like phospholipase family protein [Alistipes sp.]
MKRFFAIIITFLMLFPTFVTAQSVGVVMSGGGAKGLYHIGVLRALEENGIPIDYISGTSMGSIIGGLYASGYTIEEMEEIALSGDLERWVSGRIDPKHNYYYINKERLSSMIRVPIGSGMDSHRRRVELPGAVMNTAEIDIALNDYFAPATAASKGNFDSLMIPYTCIATDIYNHRAVELRSGDLARAIRASMAIPVAFPPITIDSVLMCDGGCYDNFPWRSLDKTFHPDILIGVSCTRTDSKLPNDATVVEQLMSLITMPSDFDMPKDRSVLIKRLVDVSMLDFSSAADVMAQGYNDALAVIPEIKALVSRKMSDEEYAKRRREFRSRFPEGKMGVLTVKGINEDQQEVISRMMNIGSERRSRAGEEAMLMDDFGDNYLSMLVNGSMRGDFPTFTFNEEEQEYDVTLPLRVRPRFDIAIGGNISSTAFNQAYIGLNYLKFGKLSQSVSLDILLGPVYSLARLKGRTTLIYDAPLYFDYAYNFNIRNTLSGNFGNLTEVDNSEQIRMMENFISLAAGTAFERKSVAELRLNIGLDSYRYAVDEKSERLYTNFHYIAPAIIIERSSLNKDLFPTKGLHFVASAIYVYGRDRNKNIEVVSAAKSDMIRKWWGTKFQLEHYIPIIPRETFTLGYDFECVFTTHPQFDTHEATMLSSPLYAPLLHSRMIYMPEFRARRYVGFGLMPTVRIYKNLYARLSVHAMARDRFEGKVMHYMSDLSFIYHTPIGPVSLALTKYNMHNNKNFYLTFNFGYAIFGRKGLYY